MEVHDLIALLTAMAVLIGAASPIITVIIRQSFEQRRIRKQEREDDDADT